MCFNMNFIIKPTRCSNFSNLFLEWNSTCFGHLLCPSSGVFHCTHTHTHSLRAGSGRNCSSVLILLASCHQTCMQYTIAVCTVKNSWWWTEELSETNRVLFQKQIWEISASNWFCYKNLSRCTVTWTPKYEFYLETKEINWDFSLGVFRTLFRCTEFRLKQNPDAQQA